ncbi:28373_t:CDS:2, partial [Dentiscutata erythropus]
ICNGLRPNLDIVNIPQLLKSLIIKYWGSNPLLRPKAAELQDYFKMWHNDSDPADLYISKKLSEHDINSSE